jgi:CubicO group peptidase (beta-lactamase class C family)
VLQDELAENVRRHAAGRRPSFTAAQVLVVVDGTPAADVVHGLEAAYADAAETPSGDAAAVTPDTRFDLASVTKLFTAAVLLEVLADHGLSLETPVGDVLPAYRGRDTRFGHLLGHTAGLPPVWSGWREAADPADARRRVLALAPVAAAGVAHVYSCVGYMHAGFAAEELAGVGLDVLVARRITGPLGMTATGYRPAPGTPVAATEWQEHPAPGITRGAVHDEAAGAPGVLRESTRSLMSQPLPSPAARPDYLQAAGARLADPAGYGPLAAGSLGHTGFTGTMLLVNPERSLTLVVLTNRVHPSREWNDPSVFRQDVAGVVGTALGSEGGPEA